MAETASDIVTDALRELGVLNAVDPPSGEDGVLGLRRLNTHLDNLNAEACGVYAEQFSTFVLTPSLNPHTLGPTGTWVLAARPEALSSAALVIAGTTPVYLPIDLRDEDWYAQLSVPTLTSLYPSDLFYEKAWPNGNLRFWPVPTSALTVRLGHRVVLAALAAGDTFSLPPGYRDLLMLETAVAAASAFRVAVSQETKDRLKAARTRVYGANDRVPRLATRDSGVPSGGTVHKTFNYLKRL